MYPNLYQKQTNTTTSNWRCVYIYVNVHSHRYTHIRIYTKSNPTPQHPHSYVWHDSFTCVTWLTHMNQHHNIHIHVCDMTHSHVWHDSLIWTHPTTSSFSPVSSYRLLRMPSRWQTSSRVVLLLCRGGDKRHHLLLTSSRWQKNSHELLLILFVGTRRVDRTNLCRRVDRTNASCYGVATISRLLKIIGLFCKRAL